MSEQSTRAPAWRKAAAAACGALLLAACGQSGGPQQAGPGAALPPPVAGTARAGESYQVIIPGADGQDTSFQVLEPQTFEGSRTYPLVLHSHGFGNTRATSYDDAGEGQVGNIALLTANGYGVLSIDMRAHGDSGGQIRVHDPDSEIQDVLLVLDWAEDNLPWVTRHPHPVTGEPDLLLGAHGGSYGGAFQFLTNAIDPKQRLDAMVPSNTWYDLSQALNQNDVFKSGWVALLFGGGNNAGDRQNNFDPFVTQLLADTLTSNRMNDAGKDFLRYHSPAYFCEAMPVANNGDRPARQPAAPPPAIPTLLTIGMRDTLFKFNDALANARCLRALGAPDVRLLGYEQGHNTIFPGPGVMFQPRMPTAADRNCAGLSYNDALLAFFDEHLKGQAGRLDAVMGPADDVCVSLNVNAGVLMDINNLPANNSEFVIDSATVPLTATTGNPMVLGEPLTVPAAGAVAVGLPRATISLGTAGGLGSDPILMLGIGHRRAAGNGQGVWDLMENQVTTIRGAGDYNLDLAAIAEPLAAGDEVAVLAYASYQTHQASATRDPQSAVMTVTGTVAVPIHASDTLRSAPQP